MLTDNQILLVAALITVLILALSVNYYFYKRQEALEQRRIRSKKLKNRIEHTLGVLTVLKRTPCDNGLIEVMNNYIITMFEELNRLSPNPSLAQQIEASKKSPDEGSISLNNVALIKQAQQSIGQSNAILKELKDKGRLTPILFAQYQQEVLWIHALVEVDAHIDAATQKAEEGNKAAAITHCKHAKIVLSKTAIKDDRKDAKLKEVQRLLDDWSPKTSENESVDITPPSDQPQKTA